MEEQMNDQSAGAAEQHVYDKVEESAESIRERAVQLKTSLADRLESGAGTLRRRVNDTSKLDDAIATTKERVAGASDRVASGMEKSAEWLRDADVASFKRGIERQVRDNPGTTLLVAGAIGYVLGRAFKGKDA
ncbi:MAG: hypothetical protein ABI446_05350 [Gemmatimonadaceae bacterium]